MVKLPEIKLPPLPFLKVKDSFAADLGSTAVKIVHLKPVGNKYSLTKWGILTFSDSGAELSPQDRKNLSAARLGEFLAKEKILTKNVVSSVSGNQVIVRYVKFPKLSREELSKTIQFEAEPYIPFDIKEVDLSFHILGEVTEEGQKKMETILVAAKKELMQSRLEILNDLNLRTIVFDLDAFALANAYEMNSDPAVNENVLMINIGSTVTNMAIIENQVLRVVRDVFISGSSFSKAIQRNMSCDAKAAEDFKTRYGLLVTIEEKEKTLAENQKEALQVSTAITPVARDLLTEVHRSIDFYVSQNPEKSINKVLLSGGTANLKNLDKYFSQELKMPVEIFNPLQNVEGGDTVPLNMACQLAIAVGLAARRENDVPKK
ncbi:MAG: type IV pilus assembly protein PilM [Elusimicrobiota bacterium]